MDMMALGVQQPQINTVGNYLGARKAATDEVSQNIQNTSAKMAQEAAALEQIATMGLGVMGGKLDGPVDPKAFDQMLGMLGNNPLAAKLKANPDLLPVITRGSMSVLQASQNEQEFELRKKNFELDLQKFEASMKPAAPEWHDLTDPDERAAHGIPPEDKSMYQVNVSGEIRSPGGKGQTINVGGNNDIGTIPPGFYVKRDAAGAVIGMAPIPGGPADTEAAAAADKTALGTATAKNTADVVTTDIGRALEAIAKDPDWTTGIGALATGWVPSSDAKSVNSFIDTVKSNISVDKLQKMRESSPTGGALGSVTEKEEKMLADTAGNLDPSMKREDFEYNLKRVYNLYRDVIDGPNTGQRYDLNDPAAPLVDMDTRKDTKGTKAAPTVPPDAEETKTLDGKTYYRVGADWFEAD